MTGPTHKLGETLDLIVTSHDCSLYNLLVDPADIFSDHSLVTGQLLFKPHNIVKKKSLFRSWNRVDSKLMISCLKDSPISKFIVGDDVETIFELFNKELVSIADKVAPLHMVEWRHVPSAPWFDKECKEIKIACRRKERRFRASGKASDKEAWINVFIDKNIC